MARRVKTPSLLQMEVAECGAASLGIMLAHYGRIVPLAELREDCGVSRDGSNALALVQAARNYGFEANGYSVEIDALDTVRLPFVVFWDFNHFLVVEGFRGDRVLLNDPATGRRSVRTHYDRLEDGETILATRWMADRYRPIDAVYLSREFTSGPGRSRTLRNTLERDPDFRRRFPAVHRFDDGALLFTPR